MTIPADAQNMNVYRGFRLTLEKSHLREALSIFSIPPFQLLTRSFASFCPIEWTLIDSRFNMSFRKKAVSQAINKFAF